MQYHTTSLNWHSYKKHVKRVFPGASCAPLIGQIGWYLICAISPEYIRRSPEYIIPHNSRRNVLKEIKECNEISEREE